MRARKYRRGKVLTVAAALKHINEGRYVYWLNKPQHPSWLISMSLHTLVIAARKRWLREAIRTETKAI